MSKVTGNRLKISGNLNIALLLTLLVFFCSLPFILDSIQAYEPLPPQNNTGIIIDHGPKNPGIRIGNFFGFGNITSLGTGTSVLVTPIFSLAMALVLIYFLMGSFKYLRSGGNKEDVAGARQIIEHSIFGFILLIFAFLVLQFLLSSLFGVKDFQIIK